MPFESTATMITICLISGIMAVYVSVLRRNGWIGRVKIEPGPKNITPIDMLQRKKYEVNMFMENNENCKLQIETSESESLKKETEEPPRDQIKKEQPSECKHHFGYIGTQPKGTELPDECYYCTKLIECTNAPHS
jgi:hypothetical protein